MSSKSFCNSLRPQPAIKACARWIASAASVCAFAALMTGAFAPCASADAPGWMHGVVNAPLPTHDEKTNAVILYSEDILTVQSNGKIKRIERRAYKILRPDGRHLGRQHFVYDAETKINKINGWCIPALGKDFEVKEKDMTDTAYMDVEGGELYTDLRAKVMQIPAADPGNIVGYEVEQDYHPYVLQDEWYFQDEYPVNEARYTLQLPPSWEYKAVWLNHPESAPTAQSGGQWQWLVKDVPEVRLEREMPPWKGVAGEMIVSIVPPGGANRGFLTWKDMGAWYNNLVQGRREASPELKQQVATITSSTPTTLGKMQALARFLQDEIRYVAIELGIGGLQPHAAPDVFKHRFGDCKDKATLLSTMLKEIGIDSYYVVIHAERGSVTANTPAHLKSFNHAILAIRLPEDLAHPPLVATTEHPKIGRILFFDPTDTLTPFGEIRGELQGNFGMLVTPDGGELVQLPILPAASNGIQRTAKLTLDNQGNLTGEVHEVRTGDAASEQRYALRAVQKSADQIKSIETLMAHSLGTFQVTKASVTNLKQNLLPFEYNWSFVAPRYGKAAGELLLVRPRVLGVKTSDLLETKDPRKYPIELEGPRLDTDVFEIALPAGYEVDDLPAPVQADYEFASYRSKAEVSGNVLRYTRSFELKNPSIPLNRIEDLKKLYRIIATDERNNAVLKPASSAKN
jgi:Domain of Unknown Function with PDB structure (DUF3857)/Transglutaminase-like superfamily